MTAVTDGARASELTVNTAVLHSNDRRSRTGPPAVRRRIRPTA